MNNQHRIGGESQPLLNGTTNPQQRKPFNSSPFPFAPFNVVLYVLQRLGVLSLIVVFSTIFMRTPGQNALIPIWLITNWLLYVSPFLLLVTFIHKVNDVVNVIYQIKRHSNKEIDFSSTLKSAVKFAAYPLLVASVIGLISGGMVLVLDGDTPNGLRDVAVVAYVVTLILYLWYAFPVFEGSAYFSSAVNPEDELPTEYTDGTYFEAREKTASLTVLGRALRYSFWLGIAGIIGAVLFFYITAYHQLYGLFFFVWVLTFAGKVITENFYQPKASSPSFDGQINYEKWFLRHENHPRQKYFVLLLLLILAAILTASTWYFIPRARVGLSALLYFVAAMIILFIFPLFEDQSVTEGLLKIGSFLLRVLGAIFRPWHYVNALGLSFLSEYPEFRSASSDYNVKEHFDNAKMAELLPIGKRFHYYALRQENLIHFTKTPGERTALRNDLTMLMNLFGAAVRYWELPTNNPDKRVLSNRVQIFADAADYAGQQRSLLDQQANQQTLEPDAFRFISIRGGEAQIIRDVNLYLVEVKLFLPRGTYNISGEIDGESIPATIIEIEEMSWLTIPFKDRGYAKRTGSLMISDLSTGNIERIVLGMTPF